MRVKAVQPVIGLRRYLSARRMVMAVLFVMYAVMWVGGVGAHIFSGGTPADAQWAAPVFLLLAALLVLAGASRWNLAGLVTASVIGFAAEVIGVRYGFLFGPYGYTDALSVKLFDVPLVMIAAWMVLVAYVRQMTLVHRLPVWLEVLIAALWMTAIDLVIDPLAAGALGYWRWAAPGGYYGIPATNFVGWFVVSLVIFSLLSGAIGRRWRASRTAAIVGLSIILFFTSIAFMQGLLLAAGFGAALCLVHLAAVYSQVAHARQNVKQYDSPARVAPRGRQ